MIGVSNSGWSTALADGVVEHGPDPGATDLRTGRRLRGGHGLILDLFGHDVRRLAAREPSGHRLGRGTASPGNGWGGNRAADRLSGGRLGDRLSGDRLGDWPAGERRILPADRGGTTLDAGR